MSAFLVKILLSFFFVYGWFSGVFVPAAASSAFSRRLKSRLRKRRECRLEGKGKDGGEGEERGQGRRGRRGGEGGKGRRAGEGREEGVRHR